MHHPNLCGVMKLHEVPPPWWREATSCYNPTLMIAHYFMCQVYFYDRQPLHDQHLLLYLALTSWGPHYFDVAALLHVPCLLWWFVITSCTLPTFMWVRHFMSHSYFNVLNALHVLRLLLCTLITSWSHLTFMSVQHFMFGLYFYEYKTLHAVALP
jgi:hypothetical protein